MMKLMLIFLSLNHTSTTISENISSAGAVAPLTNSTQRKKDKVYKSFASEIISDTFTSHTLTCSQDLKGDAPAVMLMFSDFKKSRHC